MRVAPIVKYVFEHFNGRVHSLKSSNFKLQNISETVNFNFFERVRLCTYISTAEDINKYTLI